MSTRSYRNFTLHASPISRQTGRFKVKISGLVPGPEIGFGEEEDMAYDPAAFEVESGGRTVSLLQLMMARMVTAANLYRLGKVLSGLLLPGKIRGRLLESLRVVRSNREPKGLRLRLMIEEPELSALPWEYLYLPPEGEERDDPEFFLALMPDVSIARHELIREAEPDIERRAQYRLVVAMAAPTDQPDIKVGEDRKAITRVIERGERADAVEPHWVDAASRGALREALRDPADIFHFAGHGTFKGGKGQVILEKGPDRKSDYYDARYLAKLLRGARVRLAVLNACEGGARSGENPWGGAASAMVRGGLAAVVASQYKLQDRNAVPLAEELYRGVLSGGEIDAALSAARLAIYDQAGLENRDWGSPVLYLRVENGVIFPRTEAATARLVPRVSPTPLQIRLIGRERELAKAEDALSRRSKCYLYGTYGIGKTSLAVESFLRAVKAKTPADGFLWGSVRSMNAEQALEWLGSQFTAQGVARAVGVEAKVNALRGLLSQRQDLLIGLDEVHDPAAAKAILEASGGCAVILNGARPFNSGGLAQEIALPPLSPQDAESLFLEVANIGPAALRPEDLEVIRNICAKMKFHPMAVKLAAAKCAEGSESIDTLWARISRAPGTLVEADTIFATLYEDLKKNPEALRMLVRLASFPTREAPLAALHGGRPDLSFFQAKDKLLALELINPAGRDRLSLHPVLGLGVEKDEPAAIETERENTSRWLQDYADRMRDSYDALESERANLLALADWLAERGRWDEVVSTLRPLFDFLRVRGQWGAIFQRLDDVMAAAAGLTTDHLRGWAHLHRGIIHSLRASYEEALTDFDAAEAMFHAPEDRPYRGKVEYRRATIHLVRGKTAEGYQGLIYALHLFGEDGFRTDRAEAHERLAGVLAVEGHLRDAHEQYAKSLELGDDEQKSRVHLALGDLSRQAGEYPAAQQHFETALSLARGLGHVLQNALIEQEIGHVHYYQGQWDEAVRHFETARAAFEQLKYRPGLAQVRHALGNVALAHGELDQAEQCYIDAFKLNSELGHAANAAYNLYQLGVVAHRLGHTDEAYLTYQAAQLEAGRMQDRALEAATYLQLSSLDLAGGCFEEARQRADLALSLAERVKDQLTEASALYNLSLLDAQEGSTEEALKKLTAAHKKLAPWEALDAEKIKQLLAALAGAPPSSGGGGDDGGSMFGGGSGFPDPIHVVLPGRNMNLSIADDGLAQVQVSLTTVRTMKSRALAGGMRVMKGGNVLLGNISGLKIDRPG